MSITEDSRSTNAATPPICRPSAGPDSLNGHGRFDTQARSAVEGQNSPQAKCEPAAIEPSPAGSKTSRSQSSLGTQSTAAAADYLPGGHGSNDTQASFAAGDQAPVPTTDLTSPNPPPSARDQVPPAVIAHSSPKGRALLADPLLALAADVLDDLEKVRIANENRLRQLTRSGEDSDGIDTRGWGLDLAHPAVARVAAMVKAMKCDSMVVLELTGEKTPRGKNCCLEHDAEKNLAKHLREHPLGVWAKQQKGLGEKQFARLLAAIGDPYVRPEITREDGTVEPPRPRTVSELWAYTGYHVVPADHKGADAHIASVGGELNGSGPGQKGIGTHHATAGVAPKRQRGQRANWSATAKMRAFLIAESCIKQSGTPHRAVYDAARIKYAEAIHAAECARCGPKGKPAPIGSPLSDGHKHARALRAVAKEVLRDLWREAKRIHETSVSGHLTNGPQKGIAADGADLPSAMAAPDTRAVPPTALSARPKGAEDSAAA